MSTCTRWLFILSLPVLLFCGSVRWAVNEIHLYQYGFNKYNVSQVTGIEKTELLRAARELIRYFNCADGEARIKVTKDGKELDLFSEREVIHIKDVKSLIQLDYRLQRGALAYLAVYLGVLAFWRRRHPWQSLAWAVVWGSVITLAVMAVLGIGTLFNFEQLFLQFHLFSFSNEYWILDPSKHYLIMMFPQGFFYDAALFVSGAIAIEAFLIGGISGWLLLRARR